MAALSELTTEELQELIESIVERKLLDLLGDPDEGLLLSDAVKQRLMRQREEVQSGERGRPLEAILNELQ
ncbi:MAG: hypothetical protein D6790_10970 [Caldilineae bacterium]|nr:MAG: hypothetical protein D6790_10970 [Caldilineae bacterium]